MSGLSDLALLRRFEPVVRYTRGERFFPMNVERYIRECSLWVERPDEPPELLVPDGQLTVEELVKPRHHGFGAVYYMKLIEPLDLLELAKYSLDQAVKSISHRDGSEMFHAGLGRLARVGLFSRFVDAVLSITLLLHGRVPGDTAAAAALNYRRMQKENEQYCYYGRVVRENGWICLQYWFFYPFNNWRSSFFGLNDHEGDWEMITIYGSIPEGDQEKGLEAFTPQWVAYASHDYSGDNLRRRWDDPEVEKVADGEGGCHPVVYTSAGSHASYFSAGEYITEVELPFLTPVSRIVSAVRHFWVERLRLGSGQNGDSTRFVFRAPYIDYARGDGFSLGPSQDHEWEAHTVDAKTPWAVGYRGLWGLFSKESISGENAPAGPVFNRDGSVRRCWYDPLGWAGLDKVPPPDEALELLTKQRNLSQGRVTELQTVIASKSTELHGLGIEIRALSGIPHMEDLYRTYEERIENLSQELAGLRREYTVEYSKLQAFDQYEQRLREGDRGPLREHIEHARLPSSALDLRLGRIAEAFAAISIGLVIISIVILIVFAREYLVFSLAIMIGLLIFIEAGFRRRLAQLISSLVLGLAVVSAFILLFEFFWEIVVTAVLAAGLYIMWENIREIRSWS